MELGAARVVSRDMAIERKIQHERPGYRIMQWGKTMRSPEGEWVPVIQVRLPERVKLTKEDRVARAAHIPAVSKRRSKVLWSKDMKYRDLDGEPTKASVKLARAQRIESLRPVPVKQHVEPELERKARNKRKAYRRKHAA